MKIVMQIEQSNVSNVIKSVIFHQIVQIMGQINQILIQEFLIITKLLQILQTSKYLNALNVIELVIWQTNVLLLVKKIKH